MAIKSIQNLNDLFIHELSEMVSVEEQLAAALPALAEAAHEPALREAFEAHLEETRGQLERLEDVAESLGVDLSGSSCKIMQNMVAKGEKLVESIDKGPVRDAALISAAQKAEHFEIASYGTLCAYAKHLGLDEVIELLKMNLDEEVATDEKLTNIAEGASNKKAVDDDD